MVENQDIRALVQNLIREERWDDALKLLQQEERTGDLLVMQAQVEAVLGVRTRGEAGMLQYINTHAKQYQHIEIANRLLAIGHSEADINNAFEELGLNPIFLMPQSRRTAVKRKEKDLLTGMAIGFGVFLVCLIVVPALFIFVMTATCHYG